MTYGMHGDDSHMLPTASERIVRNAVELLELKEREEYDEYMSNADRRRLSDWIVNGNSLFGADDLLMPYSSPEEDQIDVLHRELTNTRKALIHLALLLVGRRTPLTAGDVASVLERE